MYRWQHQSRIFLIPSHTAFRDENVAWWTSVNISNKHAASISYPEGEGSSFSKILVPTSKTSGHDISQDMGYTHPGC
jgi:hypothetical protein